jgi:hypothetical protein
MQKQKGISSDQNNKSCSIIHNGSNKIGFTFFWIFCDFLRNLQGSAIQFNYLSYLLQKGPRKETKACNVAPTAAGRCGFCNSGEAGGVLARGRGGGGSRGVLGLVWAGVGGGETAGGSGPRLPAAAAAGAAAPAQQAPGWGLG